MAVERTLPSDLAVSKADRTATGRRRIRAVLSFARRHPIGAAGGVALLLLILVAALAPWLAPYGANETNLLLRLKSPSSEHWFGTDDLGRDVLSRIIYGSRTTLTVSAGSALIAMCFAVTIGVASGYFGGWFDLIVQRIVDAWMAFPTLVLLLSLVAVLGVGLWQVVGVLSMLLTFGGIRVVRSATLGFRQATFVESAQVVGASQLRIIVRHILPNLFGPIMVLTTMGLSTAILAEASLSFLGFGVPPPAPSWGRMLSGSSALYLNKAPWLAIFPGLAISIVVFAVNMFGDALRDELDPRLRGSR